MVLAFPAIASHISETIELANGWNAIYLESTPIECACDNFFNGLPVTKAQAYISDAYEDTAQYKSDGTEINQKPISFYQWIAGQPDISSLKTLFGGSVYLIYATNSCTKTFFGTPAAPSQSWRAASSVDGYINLAGVSAFESVTASQYFGEGPFGSTALVFSIGGTGNAPSFLPMSLFGKSPKLASGKAYALSAERADDWPGVIRLTGSGAHGIDFGKTSRRATLTVINAGKNDRTFSFTIRASERSSDLLPHFSRFVKSNPLDSGIWTDITAGTSWEKSLRAGDSLDIELGLDRSDITNTNYFYGALFEIRDLGGSGMRVRLPIWAEAAENAKDGVNAGVWLGGIQLNAVSSLENSTPMPATGTMKATLLLDVPHDDDFFLCQRLTLSGRRVSCAMMSTENERIHAEQGSVFGDHAVFKFVTRANAIDNPFRHAWHPDHDGVDSTYENLAPSGDDLNNYMYSVKPELWSITNTVTLSWKDEGGTPYYSADPAGISAGAVEWKVEGLSNKPIFAKGAFSVMKVKQGEVK